MVVGWFSIKRLLFLELAGEGFELYHLKKNRKFAGDQTVDKKPKRFNSK